MAADAIVVAGGVAAASMVNTAGVLGCVSEVEVGVESRPRVRPQIGRRQGADEKASEVQRDMRMSVAQVVETLRGCAGCRR